MNERAGTCSVDGCGRSVWARGLCGGHYHRWYQHGAVSPEVPLGAWPRVHPSELEAPVCVCDTPRPTTTFPECQTCHRVTGPRFAALRDAWRTHLASRGPAAARSFSFLGTAAGDRGSERGMAGRTAARVATEGPPPRVRQPGRPTHVTG